MRSYKCYACKQLLPEVFFSKDSNRGASRPVNGKCKVCMGIYVAEHKKKHATKFKLYMAEHYERNKEHHKAVMSKWRESNKDLMLQYWHNYIAKRQANGPIDSGINITALIVRDNGTCQICGEPCLDSPSIDHIIPVSKGGTHTWNNVQLAHLLCNIRKGNTYEPEIVDVC